MSIFSDKEQHTANPPETWRVAKVPGTRRWCLVTATGDPALAGDRLDMFESRSAALYDRQFGFMAELWRKETRWYAGESIPGWRDYATVSH